MPYGRTRTLAAQVGNRAQTPTKPLEAALDAHIRDGGLGWDRLGLAVGCDGETLRLACDPGDRHVLAASRLVPLLRALGTPEPLNAYLRLPECRIGGELHQLVPVVAHASSGDVLLDAASGSRELGAGVEAIALSLADGRLDPVEAAAVLHLVRPCSERLLGLCAQLEAIARRGEVRS